MIIIFGLILGEGFGLVFGVRVSELVVDLSVYEFVEIVVVIVVFVLYSSLKLSVEDLLRRELGKMIFWTLFLFRFFEMVRGVSVWVLGITRVEVFGVLLFLLVFLDDFFFDLVENRII